MKNPRGRVKGLCVDRLVKGHSVQEIVLAISAACNAGERHVRKTAWDIGRAIDAWAHSVRTIAPVMNVVSTAMARHVLGTVIQIRVVKDVLARRALLGAWDHQTSTFLVDSMPREQVLQLIAWGTAVDLGVLVRHARKTHHLFTPMRLLSKAIAVPLLLTVLTGGFSKPWVLITSR